MKKYLFLSAVIYTVITVFYFFVGWSQLAEGLKYIYSLDDVYIHLALAANFAESGVWSVNSTGFDSASSSILYTLLLSSLIKIFGDWEYYPLVVNFIFGYLTIYAVYRYFSTFFGPSELRWSLVLLLPFTLLHFSVLISMEHTVHMFLMVMAVYLIHKNTVEEFRGRAFLGLLAITFLISLIRFESMFFTFSLAFAIMLRQNFRQAAAVLVAGFMPIVIFGIISIQSGGFFFPNSVLIKGSYPSSQGILESAWLIFKKGLLFNKEFYKYLFFPFLILLCYLLSKYSKKSIPGFLKNETLIITVVAMGLLQSLLAILSMRYENYVLISVLLITVPVISSFWRSGAVQKWKTNFYNLTMIIGISGLAFISVYRFIYFHSVLQVAPRNISEQQIEMSRFLKEFYSNDRIVANDIGAIAYFSNVQLLDIVGLGSTEVVAKHLETRNLELADYNRVNSKFIGDYCAANQYKIAVIYTDWFPGEVPQHWTLVASWTIKNNRGTARDRVDFYALNEKEVLPLREHLSRFLLNPNVQETIYNVKINKL